MSNKAEVPDEQISQGTMAGVRPGPSPGGQLSLVDKLACPPAGPTPVGGGTRV